PPVMSAIFPSSLPTYFSSAVICSLLRLHQILIASTTPELSHPNIYRTWSAKVHVRNMAVKRHSIGKDVADTFCRSRVALSHRVDEIAATIRTRCWHRAQLHDRRRQKRLGLQFFGVTGIVAVRAGPCLSGKQERPRLSATRLRRPRPKWR